MEAEKIIKELNRYELIVNNYSGKFEKGNLEDNELESLLGVNQRLETIKDELTNSKVIYDKADFLVRKIINKITPIIQPYLVNNFVAEGSC